MTPMDAWGKIARLSREEIFDLQNRKLVALIHTHLYPFSPYYHRLFQERKINPQKIRTVKDFHTIPFTSKRDLLASEDNPTQYRDYILQPNEAKIRKFWPATKLLSLAFMKMWRGGDYVQEQLAQEYRPIFMTYTTGTTNAPVPFLYTQYDIDNLYTSGARMLQLFKIGPAEKVLSMFPYAPHLAFWQVVFGGLALNLFILSTGGGKVLGTEGNVAALVKMQPSVILGVPSYVYHVLRIAREKGCRLESVKKVVLGAARVTHVFKQKLAALLEEMGAREVSIFGTYGFTEARSAWAECPTAIDTSSGYHLYPDKEIFEIVDPKTGEVKGEGEDGEIVYTPLDARGSVILRYRTGDFAKGGITYEPCPHCGKTVPRLSSDIVRLSDVKDLNLSKIKGALVDLNHLAQCLSDCQEVEEWQIEIRKKDNDPFEVDQLLINVCAQNCQDKVGLAREITNRINVATEITPNEIRFLSYKEMIEHLELETANKEKRIVDKRPKD